MVPNARGGMNTLPPCTATAPAPSRRFIGVRLLRLLCLCLLVAACAPRTPIQEAAGGANSATLPSSSAQPQARHALETPQTLVALAAEMNKGLPRRSDGSARWDAVIPGPGKWLTYQYTIEDFDAAFMTLDVEGLRQKILRGLCVHPRHKRLLQVGVSKQFIYHDAGGTEIGRFSVGPCDCEGGFPDDCPDDGGKGL